jgi:hypothetical protein
MEGAQVGKAGRPGRATVVVWTLAGGIAGIVFGIVRVFESPGCIHKGSFSGEITATRLGFCADDFWVSGVMWFLVGSAIAGGVALLVMAMKGRGARESRANRASAFRFGLRVVLIAIGSVSLVAAIPLGGVYPTGITRPYAIALGVTGAITIVVALLTLVGQPSGHRESARSRLGTVALVAGAASLLAFVVLVLGNASTMQDHTLPTAARVVPVVLGIVAALLGVLGIATSRGDAPSFRASFAALLMGLGSAIVPMSLWASSCYLFEGSTACVTH